ncbi:hypothetical protein [Dyadobacter sp. 676]|uniref:Uncharacterized protein n=1 Tax=Dyadobacter sp. 676 TaxID=3088362 RepID=A0AAU8FP30_9BACT
MNYQVFIQHMTPHTFHIPVLGLGYSIDTPVKVAKYGISSVVSIVDDELIERMRIHYARRYHGDDRPISKTEPDYRSRRITAYLDLMQHVVDEEFNALKLQPFDQDSDIDRYFSLLPASSGLKHRYQKMLEMPGGPERDAEAIALRGCMTVGDIDVNIMSKVDKMNAGAGGNLPNDIDSDALAALRGFASSKLSSSVVLSAGMNPRLYSYLENFADFFPDESGNFRKKVILKVSDYRSALIQARFLAKKGIWVSEFRIESGLNCGGHAFATEGNLLGPVLEEFKSRRTEMFTEILALTNRH